MPTVDTAEFRERIMRLRKHSLISRPGTMAYRALVAFIDNLCAAAQASPCPKGHAELCNCKAKCAKEPDYMGDLRKLCGYVQNGSDVTVKLFQDDATYDFCLRVGETKLYFGGSFQDCIEKAMKDYEEP